MLKATQTYITKNKLANQTYRTNMDMITYGRQDSWKK